MTQKYEMSVKSQFKMKSYQIALFYMKYKKKILLKIKKQFCKAIFK